MGVLAKDGFTRSFDSEASGYTRSEAVSVVFLQRAKEAKRIYANVLYSKTNNDGFKKEGITYPSGETQMKLLKEFYEDIKIPPSSLDYVEAHSTGTKGNFLTVYFNLLLIIKHEFCQQLAIPKNVIHWMKSFVKEEISHFRLDL